MTEDKAEQLRFERKVAEGTGTAELLDKIKEELEALEEDSVAVAHIYLKELKKRVKDLNI
jgi:hypothetical protein